MEFQTGVFLKFRAATKVHIGSIPPMGYDLLKDTVVEFDGNTIKIGGQSYNVPSIGSAIKAGWLVPDGQSITEYLPKSTVSKFGDAVPKLEPKTTETSKKFETAVDESEVGSYKAAAKVSTETSVKHAAEASSKGPAPFNSSVLGEDGEKQAAFKHGLKKDKTEVVIEPQEVDSVKKGNFSDPVKRTRLLDTEDVDKEMSNLEAATTRRTPPIIRANEDAVGKASITDAEDSESYLGDDLEDILPDAVSTGKPKSVVTHSQDSGDMGLSWDKTAHWKTRVKTAIDQFGNQPTKLNQILALEEPSVVKAIKAGLAK